MTQKQFEELPMYAWEHLSPEEVKEMPPGEADILAWERYLMHQNELERQQEEYYKLMYEEMERQYYGPMENEMNFDRWMEWEIDVVHANYPAALQQLKTALGSLDIDAKGGEVIATERGFNAMKKAARMLAEDIAFSKNTSSMMDDKTVF